MRYALFLIIAVMSALVALAIQFSQPLLVIVGMLLMPTVIQALPWGLYAAAQGLDGGEDFPRDANDPADDYQETGAGFTAKL